MAPALVGHAPRMPHDGVRVEACDTALQLCSLQSAEWAEGLQGFAALSAMHNPLVRLLSGIA